LDEDYDGPERRNEKRFPFYQSSPYTIRFCLSGSNQFHVSLSGNIGYGGLLLFSHESFNVDDIVDVEISYNNENSVKTVIESTVIWVDEKGKDENGNKVFMIGAQFNISSEDQENVLRDFLEKYIMKQ